MNFLLQSGFHSFSYRHFFILLFLFQPYQCSIVSLFFFWKFGFFCKKIRKYCKHFIITGYKEIVVVQSKFTLQQTEVKRKNSCLRKSKVAVGVGLSFDSCQAVFMDVLGTFGHGTSSTASHRCSKRSQLKTNHGRIAMMWKSKPNHPNGSIQKRQDR